MQYDFIYPKTKPQVGEGGRAMECSEWGGYINNNKNLEKMNGTVECEWRALLAYSAGAFMLITNWITNDLES